MRTLTVFIVLAITGAAVAQTHQDTAQLLRLNPFAAQVNKVGPALLESVLKQIDAIAPSPAQPRGAAPTVQEAAQINANPMLQTAYSRNPEATLAVLRQINIYLANAPSR